MTSFPGHIPGKGPSINDTKEMRNHPPKKDTWNCLHHTQSYLKSTTFHIKPVLCGLIWKWAPQQSVIYRTHLLTSPSPFTPIVVPPSRSWRYRTPVYTGKAWCCPEAEVPVCPEETHVPSMSTHSGIVWKPKWWPISDPIQPKLWCYLAL